MSEITETDLHEALDRVSRTPDGTLLYLYLQKTLCGVSTDSAEGTLQRDHGRRRFASELMGHMAEGISVNGRAGSVTFVTAPRDPRRRREPGSRLVGPDTVVPGFSDPEREPSSPAA